MLRSDVEKSGLVDDELVKASAPDEEEAPPVQEDGDGDDKDADDVSAEQAHRELSSEPGSVKEFVHSDSTLVRATVSQSLLRRDDDTITLAVLHDLTERLWNNPRHIDDKPTK